MDENVANPDFSIALFLSFLIPILVAYVLAIPIGLNRERASRSAGLRTFPLVAVGACGYMLIGMNVFVDGEAQSRALYGIITGIGFIGGGAILKEGGSVNGTATAASIWNTGAIGVATGSGRYEIAVVLTLLNVITLSTGDRVKHLIGEKESEKRGGAAADLDIGSE